MSESRSLDVTLHIIPLRRVYFGRRKNRADRAIRLVKKYLARHYKEAEKIAVDPALNNYVWSRGREKPPRKVVVEVRFDKESKTLRVLLVRPSKWRRK
ncbi:MAG: 50S ribosomal protein L31e [Desulfurococcaceae archaeon]